MSAVDPIAAAAERLLGAADSGLAADPVRDLIGATDIDAAYRVQQLIVAERLRRGARVVGRKIGLTSEAIQRQVGVDRPDFGVLLDDMRYSGDDLIPISTLLQPRCEAEVAFVLGRDLEGPIDDAEVRAAIDYAVAALEIVDSRVADWQITITDTVADNASSGVFVLGDSRLSLAAFEPVDVEMSMTRNGEQVSRGDGRACLGDPLLAVAWLARTAIEFGHPLRAGEIVLSGALGPMIQVRPGDVFEAMIEPLGSVTARFSEKEH